MVRLTLVMIALVGFTGCPTPDPKFCTMNPDDKTCPHDGSIGPCTSDTVCMAKDMSLPVCDTTGGTCVQCTTAKPQACVNDTPRCDGDKCVACVDDTQDCGAGGLCLPSGACASPNNIVHVKTAGSSADGCGDATTPCTLDKALTVVMTTPGKTAIEIDDNGTYVPQGSNFSVDANVTIDMHSGATLHPAGDGPLLDIKTNRTVAIRGGIIEMATGSNGDGILCNDKVKLTVVGTTIRMTDKSAINMLSGCSLTITQANITNTSLRSNIFVASIFDSGDSVTISRSSIIANRGGGIAVNNGTFDIVGNAIMNNGNGMSTTGGITIQTQGNSSNYIAFNTISQNMIQIGSNSAGIACNAGAGTVGHYNIVWDNPDATAVQVTGGCKHTYSDIGPIPVVVMNDGDHNMSVNPLLKDEKADPHLKPGSPAHQYADTGADLSGLASKDIDGQPRTSPADIGADQMQ